MYKKFLSIQNDKVLRFLCIFSLVIFLQIIASKYSINYVYKHLFIIFMIKLRLIINNFNFFLKVFHKNVAIKVLL